MTSSIVYHYRATDIPYDLPTIAEIQDSEDVISAYRNRKVVRVGRHFVVNYVPKVYTLYTESCTGRNFIVMEYIEDSTLALAWPDLNAVQKSIITAKLRSFYNELRQLPSPGYFGSLGRRPLLDETFSTRENVPSINGPFETEDALNEALAQKYTYDGLSYYKAEYYRQSLPHVFRGNQPTFTHGDCQRENIMVCKVHPRECIIDADHFLEDEFEVTIIDWAKSGWYPSYWEYCLAFVALRWDDDWGLFLMEFLSPYYVEAAWIHMLRFELWS